MGEASVGQKPPAICHLGILDLRQPGVKPGDCAAALYNRPSVVITL